VAAQTVAITMIISRRIDRAGTARPPSSVFLARIDTIWVPRSMLSPTNCEGKGETYAYSQFGATTRS
jgi:hypothetical protein